MILKTAIIGDEPFVCERLRKYRKAGIDELMLHPMGADPTRQLDTLGRAVELVRDLDNKP